MLPSLGFRTLASGISHYCGDQPCSWYDFAESILMESGNIGLSTPSKLNSIETSAYLTPAKRPLYSVLDCSKIQTVFHTGSSNWRAGIKEALTRFVAVCYFLLLLL